MQDHAVEAPKGQGGSISAETLRYQESDLDGTLEMPLTEGMHRLPSVIFFENRDGRESTERKKDHE